MPKLKSDYPNRLDLRVSNKARRTLENRAKERGLSLSEYARKLVLLGLATENSLGDRQLGVKPNERQGTKDKPVEYKPEDETSRKVRETLESKGLYAPREPAKKGIRFRADGNPK